LVSKEAIDKFLNQKTLAVVGVSRSGSKFGNSVFKELNQKDINFIPSILNEDL
jgi:predicted CoA-binding protein